MELKRRKVGNVRAKRTGFTLVELLVVITIIGILVALIAVAGAGALKTARQAEIKTELDQLSMAFEHYSASSYPPNCQTDDQLENAPPEPAATPLSEVQVLTDLKRHMKQAFPRHRESESLLRILVGLSVSDTTNFPRVLAGGMTAGEAIVFWLGGFSADPRYPISGEGGPSYDVIGVTTGERRERDTLQRSWVMPLELARLAPRAEDGYFNEGDGRFIEYTVTVNGVVQTRRINFWQYVPKKSTQPYLYFDVSRHPAAVNTGGTITAPFDPPAATELTGLGADGMGLHVHAVKTINQSAAANEPPIVFANPDKFQIIHCGIDDEWGVEAFERMSAHGVLEVFGRNDKAEDYLPFPTGPFTGDVADTIVNFSSSSLEKSQP